MKENSRVRSVILHHEIAGAVGTVVAHDTLSGQTIVELDESVEGETIVNFFHGELEEIND